MMKNVYTKNSYLRKINKTDLQNDTINKINKLQSSIIQKKTII